MVRGYLLLLIIGSSLLLKWYDPYQVIITINDLVMIIIEISFHDYIYLSECVWLVKYADNCQIWEHSYLGGNEKDRKMNKIWSRNLFFFTLPTRTHKMEINCIDLFQIILQVILKVQLVLYSNIIKKHLFKFPNML